MNNTELELKIKEILQEENFFDMMEEVIKFEPEYKKSDFYKTTKLPLSNIMKDAKVFYSLNLKNIFDDIQKRIESLNLDNLMDVLNQVSEVFGQENSEVRALLEEYKNIN